MRFIPSHVNRGRSLPVMQRFLNRLVVGDPEACWEWPGAIENGYGTLNDGKGKRVFAHRLAFEHFSGPIPEGASICHKCNNRACCNPAHLYAGDYATNAQDRAQTDKQFRGTGEANPSVKLTDSQVVCIRQEHASGASLRSLAKQYNVTSENISLIINRKRWKHLP